MNTNIVLHYLRHRILPYFDYTKKNIGKTWNISIEKTNQGFGRHGLVTTAVGHGVTTHAQVGHGARIPTATAVGAAADKQILRFIKNKILIYESHLPGASQRLPVNVNGQLQRNPAPFVTHWPPFKPKHQYLSVYLKIQISSFTWIYRT